jgi:hypothetical protein
MIKENIRTSIHVRAIVVRGSVILSVINLKRRSAKHELRLALVLVL